MQIAAMEGPTSFTTAVIRSVVAALVLGTVVCRSHRLTKTPAQNILVEVSTDSQQNNIEIREMDEVIVSRSVNKHADMDQSLVIQDYHRGLQAIKDLPKDKCYVFPTSTDFLTAVKILREKKDQARPDGPIYISKTASSEPIPGQLMSAVVGQHITEFCSGIDTFWILDTPGADTHHLKRRSASDIIVITDDGYYRIKDDRDIVIDTRGR